MQERNDTCVPIDAHRNESRLIEKEFFRIEKRRERYVFVSTATLRELDFFHLEHGSVWAVTIHYSRFGEKYSLSDGDRLELHFTEGAPPCFMTKAGTAIELEECAFALDLTYEGAG